MTAPLPSASLTGARELIERYGVDPDAIARDVGMDPAALDSKHEIVQGLTFHNFLKEASVRCGNRYLNLELAECQHWGTFSAIWPFIDKAETLGDVLNIMVTYLERYSATATTYTLEDKRGLFFCFEVRWHITNQQLIDQGEVEVVEYALAISCNEVRQILGKNWHPTYTQFRHNQPEDCQPLYGCFGPNISFNQDCNAIFLTHEELATPLPANWALDKQLISDPADMLNQELSWRILTDRAIRRVFHTDYCTVESVSEDLGVAVRTLQYNLKKESTSYQNILNQIRLECAIHYLENSDLSVTEIAERLHFAETAVFSRFVKNRLGCSPSQLRDSPRQPRNKGN